MLNDPLTDVERCVAEQDLEYIQGKIWDFARRRSRTWRQLHGCRRLISELTEFGEEGDTQELEYEKIMMDQELVKWARWWYLAKERERALKRMLPSGSYVHFGAWPPE